MRSSSVRGGCSPQAGPLKALVEPRSNEEMLLTSEKAFHQGEISRSLGYLPTAQGSPVRAKPLHSRDCGLRERITTLLRNQHSFNSYSVIHSTG